MTSLKGIRTRVAAPSITRFHQNGWRTPYRRVELIRQWQRHGSN
jgi:hypothetical protein